MNSRIVLIAFVCVTMRALLAADDAAELQKKGIAALKESQGNAAALVSAARFFAKASAAFEAQGKPELAVDANSFLYYCKKKMTLKDIDAFLQGEEAAVSTRLKEVESKPVQAFEGQAWLERADAFAKKHADELFLITVRYFEVAERFKDSDVGRTAMSRSLEAMQKVIASQKEKPKVPAAPEPVAVKPAAPATPEPVKFAAAQKPKTINLLPMIDLSKDIVDGKWSVKDQQLVAEKYGHIQIPYKPPEEYDFKIVFARMSGGNLVGQIASKDDHFFAWFMDAFDAKVSGVEMLDNKNVTENETTIKGPILKNKVMHTSIVQVRSSGLTILLDGRTVVKLKTDYSKLAVHPNWKLKADGGLGLCCAGANVAVFGIVELIEITGRGEKLR